MRVILSAVAVLALAELTAAGRRSLVASEQTQSGPGAGARGKRSYDQWLDIISQYARARGSGAGAGDEGQLSGAGLWQPFPVDIPVVGKDGRPMPLPVLILPVPVPVPVPAPALSDNQACSANSNKDSQTEIRKAPEPHFAPVTSDYLVEVFRRQKRESPELPPAVIGPFPRITPPSPARGYLPPYPSNTYLPPSPPNFHRSSVVRGFLTVHRSGYTEAYTAWYDEGTGQSRVEYHDGSTTTYRTLTSDGRIVRVTRQVDKTGERDEVVCGVTSAHEAGPADRDPPALPSVDGFTFSGYREEYGVRAEVWRRELSGPAGGGGGAPGEVLSYRHELLVYRQPDDVTVPLKYSVSVDSSVLGADCDGYEHIYSEVRFQDHDPRLFYFDLAECHKQEQLDVSNAEHMARLDPFLEFTMMHRDPRHDDSFDSYVKEFERSYMDDKERAVRKNLLVQQTRFVTSCNRQGGSFQVAANFLSDRLDDELQVLFGVAFDDGNEFNKQSFAELGGGGGGGGGGGEGAGDLPREFDWRAMGGVTPVKYQEECSSCWAFAVAGSVEGALYIQTNKLVELSEQALVDCAHSHKANGCNGTWPVHAYNYIKDRGLPARDKYTPYAAKVLECKAPPVPPVTHIAAGVDVPPNDIDALKTAIKQYAPSVVVVDSHCKSFVYYKSGVLKDDRCKKAPKKKLDHAVLAVGWGEQRGEPHFILKNSWHHKWGDGGFIRVHAPSNTCGHLTTPSFALLKKENVDQLRRR